MTGEPVFKLFACCVPVRGARRSTLCDLQRQLYRFIPNALYEILTEHSGKTLAELEELYGSDSRRQLEEYFQFLTDNDFGFWCNEPDAFPPIEMVWERPERVANAIIDIDIGSSHDYERLIKQLDALGCSALQFRFFCQMGWSGVEAALTPTLASRIRSIDLLIRYDPSWKMEVLEKLCLKHQRISSVFIHSAPEEIVTQVAPFGTSVMYRRESVDSSAHCGFVHPRYFAVNLEFFAEAQKHNTCLNRKLSIDSTGNIRNCPAMARSYGNAADTSLFQALRDPEFSSLWSVGKDQVEICQDCEFRYICTDCRAFTIDPSKPNSKPLRCGYDPYVAKWNCSLSG